MPLEPMRSASRYLEILPLASSPSCSSISNPLEFPEFSGLLYRTVLRLDAPTLLQTILYYDPLHVHLRELSDDVPMALPWLSKHSLICSSLHEDVALQVVIINDRILQFDLKDEPP